MALFTLLLVASVAASALSAAVAPPPSLKHDTDVVRLARPSNRRMLVVDVVQPPPPTPDPVLTNEVDTSDDSDLPQIVRVLVPGDVDDDYLPRATADQSADLDKISEELTELRPPAEGQQASNADWSDASPSATDAPAASSSSAAPSEDLLPPPEGQADVYYWQRQRQPSEWMNHGFTSSTPKAESRIDDGEKVEEEVKEPATDLQPPSQMPVGIWELFSELKKIAATAQPRAGEVADDVLEPAADLVPPPAPASDAVDYWTQPATAVAEPKVDGGEVGEPASELLPPPEGPADFTEWTRIDAAKVQTVPEPATHLVPPARDSYMPEKPSSGEAGVDDFLTLGSVPAADSNSTYEREQTDSYLPHVGEIKSLVEGPVSDVDKESAEQEGEETKKDSYEKDSYLPEKASSSGESVEGLTPPEDKPKTSLKDEDDDGTVEAKEADKHEHEHDETHVTTPSAIEHEDSDEEVGDDEVDGDGVKMSISKDLRKKRHICKMCGGYGGGHGFGGGPAISIVIQKPEYGGGGGGGYCDVCGRPHPQPVHQPVYQPVYQPVQQPVYKEPIYEEPCHSCNQPPQPPPCSTCGGGGGGHGGGGSQSYSQSSSSSQSSSYSSSWGKK